MPDLITLPPSGTPGDHAGDPEAYDAARKAWYLWFQTACPELNAYPEVVAAYATAAANAVLSAKANLAGADFTGPVTSGTAKSITDWNAITSSGYYMGAGATGAPDANWYMGCTIVHNELWMTQEIWAFTNNTDTDHLRYRREKNNGTWTSWVRVYGTPEEITTFAASLNGATFLGNVVVGASAGTGEAKLEVGQGRSGDGICYIDLHSAAGADYNARVSRGAGENGNLNIENAGSGGIALLTAGAVVRQFIDPSTGVTLFQNSNGLGYGVGAGGSVTQPTSKAASVTINKPSMLVTTHDAGLAAGAAIGFQVINSTVGLNDQVVHTFVGTLASVNGNYSVRVAVGSGSFYVHLTNESGSTLSEAVPIKFDVIKGSTT